MYEGEGYGRVAYIDLAKRDVRVKDVPEVLRRRFLGGRGINVYLLYNHLEKGVDPLSPENVLIFGAGLLTGTLGVATSRGNFTAKSPETGILGDSNLGGHFSPEVRAAGFDHLVIKGRAERPTYLWVHDGQVEFVDARGLEGLDVIETQRAIRKDLGEPNAQIACIGPAGRRLVRFACIRHGVADAAGRTGMGCVMGSKNLWAIAARGTMELPVKHPERLMEVFEKHYKQVTSRKGYWATRVYGTLMRLNITRTQGFEGGRNHQCNMMPELGEEMDAEVFIQRYEYGKLGCFNCPVFCKHLWRVKEGPYAGLEGAGLEYYVAGGYGSQCGCSSWDVILKAFDLCNRYGLDVGSMTAYTAWLMELYEKGIITKEDTGGLALEWGSPEAILGLIEQVMRGEGIGALIAMGWRHAAQKIGRGAEEYMDHVKGLTIEPDDVRSGRAEVLGLATSTRGACHLRSRYTLEEFALPEEVSERVTGRRIPSDPASYEGKEWACFWVECLCAVADALGVCKFVTQWLSTGLLGFEQFAESIYCVTGMELKPSQVMEAGERIWNMEKLFLVREGLRRRDDTVPRAFYKYPWKYGPRKGMVVDLDKFNQLLSRYYELHGWDEDGVPRPETLKRLELDGEPSHLL